MIDGAVVDGILWELRKTGIARVGAIPADDLAALNGWLLSQPVYAEAHVPETARRGGRGRIDRTAPAARSASVVCLDLRDALVAPGLLELALGLTDAVAAYLERDPPLAYSTNAFWTRPAGGIRDDIQAFHRDADDTRFLALFVYLTDVFDDADGPHQMIGPNGETRAIFGPAGTAFLADTRNEHCGLKPTRGEERGIAWFRWGVSDPPVSYVWDRNAPIAAAELGDRYPADPRLRESLRLLVTPP